MASCDAMPYHVVASGAGCGGRGRGTDQSYLVRIWYFLIGGVNGAQTMSKLSPCGSHEDCLERGRGKGGEGLNDSLIPFEVRV